MIIINASLMAFLKLNWTDFEEKKSILWIDLFTFLSGALPGLMLILGLFEGCFFQFLAPGGPYRNPFPNPAGQS